MRRILSFFSGAGDAGFSIVELVVVTGIIVLLSGLLLFNFRATSTTPSARSQVAAVVISDIRRVQSMALAGTAYPGIVVCGYGVHYVNATTYLLYVRSRDGVIPCATSRNYQPGDPALETKSLIHRNTVFQGPFADIFFELPGFTTYLNNNPALAQPPVQIFIALLGDSGPAAVISVSASGTIDIK